MIRNAYKLSNIVFRRIADILFNIYLKFDNPENYKLNSNYLLSLDLNMLLNMLSSMNIQILGRVSLFAVKCCY